jgi:hypothetical protein
MAPSSGAAIHGEAEFVDLTFYPSGRGVLLNLPRS